MARRNPVGKASFEEYLELEAIDRGEKPQNYTTIPTLQSYVLVSQDKPLVEVFERQRDGN